MPEQPLTESLILVHKQTVYGLCMTPALGFIPIRSFEDYDAAYAWILGELTKKVGGLDTEIEQIENYLRFMIVPDFSFSVVDRPDVLAPQLIADYLNGVV